MKRFYVFAAMFLIFVSGLFSGIFSEALYDEYIKGQKKVCKRCGFSEFKYVDSKDPKFERRSPNPPWARGVKKREDAKREQHFREKMFNWMLSDRLKLTPEQREKHFQLVLENKRNLASIMDPIRDQVRQEFDRSYRVMKEILTPEQQEEFQKIICEFEPPGLDIDKVVPPLDSPEKKGDGAAPVPPTETGETPKSPESQE